MRRFGIDTSDAALKQLALEQGLIESGGALTEQQKKLLRHEIIMRDSTIAAGNFADTSDGLANQQRILSAQFEELQIRVGEKLLPVITELAGFMLDKVLPTLEVVGKELGERLGPVIETVADFVQEKLIPFFSDFGETVDGDVNPTVQAAQRFFEDGLKPAFEAVADFVQEHLAPALERLGTLFAEKILPVLVDHILPAWLKLQEILFGDVLPILLDLVGLLIDMVVPAIEEFFAALEVAIDFAGDVVDAFQDMIDFIQGLPDKITNAARGLWDGIPRPPSFITDTIGSVGGFLGFATGTRNFGGGGAIVGERGPERVVLPEGSQIIPNHQMQNMGGDVVVNVQTDADPFQIGAEVAWAIRVGR